MECALVFLKFLLFSFFFFFFLLSLRVSSSVSGEVFPQREVLLKLKSSFFDPHGMLASWDPQSRAHHCSWFGVSCNSGSTVISVNITGCGGRRGNTDKPSSYLSPRKCPFTGSGPETEGRLGCGGSKLGGKLSSWVGRLSELRVLSLPFNELGGEIPLGLWGLEKLEVVDLEGNLFSGNLFAPYFKGLDKLRVLNLGFNRLDGVIPVSLSKCVDLRVLNLAGNKFKGRIPGFMFGFVKLRGLYLGNNELSGSVPGVFGGKCRYLEHLDLSRNFLVGSIPGSLGSCRRLRTLLLDSNMLTGVIPRKLGQLGRLEVFDVSRNFIGGEIPAEIGKCIHLSVIVLSSLYETLPKKRNVSGKVEGGLSSVGDGEHNRFRGSIPVEIATLPKLRVLWAPRASLEGKFPGHWGNCRSLEIINLAQNGFSGEIGGVFVRCKKLHHLDLSSNRLSWRVDKKLPVYFMSFFDVSGNLLSGSIPRSNYSASPCVVTSNSDVSQPSRQFYTSLAHMRSLAAVNDSSTEVSATSTSLVQAETDRNQPNDAATASDTKSGNKGFGPVEIASIVSASVVVFVLLFIAVLVFWARKRIPDARIQVSEPKEITIFVDIGVPFSYETIVRSTGNFNASNCIGHGGFGATYKAEVSPGILIAVKKLAIGRIQGVQQFHTEIKTLGRLKHSNLVTLIGYHAGETEMFLIYNYLAGGNLEDFIKQRSENAVNWKIVHKIALDVAYALSYLHDQCSPRVVHRDVKPSNILLDGDFNAYLSDFGSSRLLGASETHATTGATGTFGYVAPEYAMTSHVSEKSDVYSYGVVLLELISDKRALDPSFSAHENGFNIVSWASMLLQHGKVREVFTPRLWASGPHDELVDMLHLAVMCTAETLSFRPTVDHVVRQLKQIRPN